ncbi:phosphodiester glycosidase family protein [Psychrobacillus sp. NPDC096623]|uniref:phosphodiester glycosidase family protein n=1 Tax=Psychrobacillus sp. NPDC096623 TaxID=3364492 RepID=UPI00382BD959
MQKILNSTKLLLVTILLLALPLTTSAAVVDQQKISGGVDYEYKQETVSQNPQAIRVLTTNLNDPYTKVDVGIPNPLNRLARVTAQANAYTGPGQQVAGAINGSFFSGDLLPMYLISYRNKLVNAGIIASGEDQYVNEPLAFGIDANGKAKIDTYNLDLTYTHNGITSEITSTNKQRTNDNTILFTPIFPGGTTKTNPFGMEVVISGVPGAVDLEFGETLTGTVSHIRPYGTDEVTKIPADGFVLSAHGTAMEALKQMKIGDPVTIDTGIDQMWMDASFMLTSGPMLVKDGNVGLSMDPNSSKARERAPRTAIAIDKTGTKVWMVTVDGRQSGYSTGMSLNEFAQYLKSMGAYRALNLDGGGSTAMAVRKPGDTNVSLFNKPSDGTERAVSTVLYALSTAPKGNAQYITAELSKAGVYLKGTKGSVKTGKVMDQYYNPLTTDAKAFSISSALITPSGLNFTAAKAGKGTIDVKYGTAIKAIPFEVVDSVTKIEPSEASATIRMSSTKAFSINAYDAQNRKIVFDSSLIKWGVTGEIGTISTSGQLTATNKEAKGAVTATLGGKTVSIPVTVSGTTVQLDSIDSITNWTASAAEGTASIVKNSSKEIPYEGSGALKVQYNFLNKTGTSAAYINASKSISTGDVPKQIGMRLYGDASNSWVRGKIVDGKGTEHTINFTEENGLKWKGWNFVTADIPAGVTAPVKLDQIYIAQPAGTTKTAGTILIDDVKAIYTDSYKEALFKDTGLTFRAEKEIADLVNKGVIGGYQDGKFGPYQELTRLQGAILLARALDLPTTNVQDPGFSDMPAGINFYEEVAAVANAGIIKGKDGGAKFDPSGKLTRAEMAAILQRGFKLPLSDTNYFSDTKGSFAYDAINSLAKNDITQGIGSGKFGPAQYITRVDFSVFLYRTLNK